MASTSRRRRPGSPLARGISVAAEFVREESEREGAPSNVRLVLEPGDESRDERQTDDVLTYRPKPIGERRPPLGCAQLAREHLDRRRIELELSMRVAACRQDQHCPPPRRAKLCLRDVDVPSRDERQQGLARLPRLKAGFYELERVPHGRGRRARRPPPGGA
jgi:hypothetical protein